VVANYRLRTVEFRTQERTQIGFVGWAVYECRKLEAAHVSALNALARLAFFTGVGYQTARGMGAVKTTLSN
jgi:CRISPR/Cas system endoribonuclease Cas6 (RAMP superfamily)